MLKRLFVFLSFILSVNYCIAQGNLVPNPSFEEYDICPDISPLSFPLYWFNPLNPSTPDYFNSCAIHNSSYGMPKNYFGHEFALGGMAYPGIITYAMSTVNPALSNWREYLEVQLLDSLIKGVNYCIQFYVSAGDSSYYVSNDIGVYFSKNEIKDTCTNNLPCPLSYQPQFENPVHNNLNSRIGWTKVSGTFLAKGGEQFIVIGNFKNSDATVATLTEWSKNYSTLRVAYYYVDFVSLILCDSIYNTQEAVNAYFCSETGKIKIEANEETILHLSVYSISSQLVFQKNNLNQNGNFSVEIIPLSTGIYFIILESEKNKYNFKLFKNN